MWSIRPYFVICTLLYWLTQCDKTHWTFPPCRLCLWPRRATSQHNPPSTVVWKSDPESSSVRMTCAAMTWLLVLPLMLLCVRDSFSLFLPDSKELRQLLSRYEEGTDETSNTSGNRTRRSIRWSDREEILQLHNKLRGGVYPTASNMEHMVRHVPLPQWPISPLWSINKDHYQLFSLASPHRECVSKRRSLKWGRWLGFKVFFHPEKVVIKKKQAFLSAGNMQ